MSQGRLACVALRKTIAKPQVVEAYLREIPNITEHCIPGALRDYLGLPYRPSAGELFHTLKHLWTTELMRGSRFSPWEGPGADGGGMRAGSDCGCSNANIGVRTPPTGADAFISDISVPVTAQALAASLPPAFSPRTQAAQAAEPSKFERCVMHVKDKQSDWCADQGYPRGARDPDGHKCANPWAVCHASTRS